jgi:hypothetical protein
MSYALPLAPDDSAPCGCGHTFKQHNLVVDSLFPCLSCDCVAFQIADPLPCGHAASDWQDEDLDWTDHYQPAGCRLCLKENPMRTVYARMPAFVIVRNTPKMDKPIVIRDVGPWDAYPTVTNEIEAVIEKLRSRGLLPADRRLLYYDSEGMLTEAVMEAGAFVAYRNVRGEEEEIA